MGIYLSNLGECQNVCLGRKGKKRGKEKGKEGEGGRGMNMSQEGRMFIPGWKQHYTHKEGIVHTKNGGKKEGCL